MRKRSCPRWKWPSYASFDSSDELQEIEGNPLDAEDIAMFEMFERERWSDERCRAYILARKPAVHAK